MKKIYVSLAAVALAAFMGCEASKNTPGGPGASNRGATDKKPVVGREENSFTLSTPTLSTKLKQSESKAITISIKRGKNFDQDVALKFEGVPMGVSIEPASPVLKHGDDEVKVNVKAADDAAVGDFTVKVVGHPKEGPDALSELKLGISKK